MRNILAASVLLLAVACGNSGGCGISADCPAGFDLDGVFYTTGCTEVATEFVSDVSLGTTMSRRDVARDIRRVEGVSPDVLVAVTRDPFAGCGTFRRGDSPWTAAHPMVARTSGAREAICRVGKLSPKERRDNGCR